MSERPVAYLSLTWHDPVPRSLCLLPAVALDALRRVHGSVPAALDDELTLLAFANEALIQLADADVEPDLWFPHRVFGHRQWVREEYQRFLTWCRVTGWLEANEALPEPAQPAGAEASYAPESPPAPPVEVLARPKGKRAKLGPVETVSG